MTEYLGHAWHAMGIPSRGKVVGTGVTVFSCCNSKNNNDNSKGTGSGRYYGEERPE
jgi:hypothetical protein